MIYFYSGHTDFGGSTFILSSVVQMLNESGVDALFCGDHGWFERLSPYNRSTGFPYLHSDDILVCHAHSLERRPDVKRSIYVTHEETWQFGVGRYYCQSCDTEFVDSLWVKTDSPRVCKVCSKRRAEFVGLAAFDHVVFSSKAHARKSNRLQKYWGPQSIIPNPVSVGFEWHPPSEPTAGIIGKVSRRKATLESIGKALDAGFEKVLLYGNKDPLYFNERIRPLLCSDIQYCGIELDRSKMYNSISEVFHYSTKEQACMVQGECKKLGIPFHCDEQNVPAWDLYGDDEIARAWHELLVV